jgi:hypothetical protein
LYTLLIGRNIADAPLSQSGFHPGARFQIGLP